MKYIRRVRRKRESNVRRGDWSGLWKRVDGGMLWRFCLLTINAHLGGESI